MNSLPKHVLLITSTNLACNPRCLKEVRLLDTLGFKITVVAFNLHNWTSEKEVELNKELHNVEFIYLETTKHNFFSWLSSSLMEKASSFLISFFRSNIFLQAMSVSKRSWILLQWAKKWKGKADLIIAHNPPAFYAASDLSQSRNVPFAIDMEDYHPGEGKNENQKKSISYLIKQLLPKTAYTSYASPLIKKYTENILDNKPTGIIINNTFLLSEFLQKKEIGIANKLKLVWFSQFIDQGRGLEKILPALDQFSDQIELTLIGNLRDTFFQSELKERKYIYYIGSLSQKELNNELHNYDIGLALEDKDADMNRNICLTNKIWAYFQAGLFIIASNTEAQRNFISEHPDHGIVFSFDREEISSTIRSLIKQMPAMRSKSSIRFEDAKKESWENTSDILVNEWQKIMQNH